MSSSTSTPTHRSWLAQLCTGRPHQVIDREGHPYLRRWFLIPHNRVANVYLHRFTSSDDPVPHCHPWSFLSIVLAGRYDEVTDHFTRRRGVGSIAYRPATWRHSVQLITDGNAERPCWTLVITGRWVRNWGFWCPRQDGTRRFVPWQEFGAGGCGETTTGSAVTRDSVSVRRVTTENSDS